MLRYPTLEGTLLSCATPLSRNNWGRGKYCLMLCGSTQRNQDSFSFHYPSLIFLVIYGYITKHPERVGLNHFTDLFCSWVCSLGRALQERLISAPHSVSLCDSTRLQDLPPNISLTRLRSWWYCLEVQLGSLSLRYYNWKQPVSSSLVQHHFCIFGGQRSHKSCQHLREGT